MNNKHFQFSIADIHFQMIHSQLKVINDSFLPFLKEGKNDWTIEYIIVNELLDLNNSIVYQDRDRIVVLINNELVYYYIDRETNKSYAYSKIEYDKKKVAVYYLEEYQRFFNETNNSFYHTQWERVMIEENRLLLHSSCIETTYRGILFTGKSGIGKTTQSNLWVKYENARVINGDRPILYNSNGIWKAYGSPYAGSSKVHINESTSISCIVVLQQGKVNQLRRLSVNEAFKMIYKNITVNTWDHAFMNKALDQVIQLVSSIPVYELVCLPDQSAVEVLKKELERGM